MWCGVTYVEQNRRTLIHEGHDALLVVTDAGPGVVYLSVLFKAGQWPGTPDAKMHMPPGNTRAASGTMVGLGFADHQTEGLRRLRFAAVAWRVVP